MMTKKCTAHLPIQIIWKSSNPDASCSCLSNSRPHSNYCDCSFSAFQSTTSQTLKTNENNSLADELLLSWQAELARWEDGDMHCVISVSAHSWPDLHGSQPTVRLCYTVTPPYSNFHFYTIYQDQYYSCWPFFQTQSWVNKQRQYMPRWVMLIQPRTMFWRIAQLLRNERRYLTEWKHPNWYGPSRNNWTTARSFKIQKTTNIDI